MIVKIIGAILVLSACFWVGFSKASQHRRREQTLEQLIQALEYMKRELEYALLPLPELCRRAAKQCTGKISILFDRLAQELDKQLSADAACCMDAALLGIKGLPESTADRLRLLGRSLGRFDVTGQLSGLQGVAELCKRDLEGLYSGREERIRSYQTLALCAGAALVILFI